MKYRTLSSAILLVLGSIIIYCAENRLNPNQIIHSQNKPAMQKFVSIVEIPATDISRAVKFYQSILDIQIESIEMQGTEMGIFPADGQSASVVITKGEGYEPSATGVLVYLNGGEDLEPVLKKIEKSGGQILLAKTLIDEENGYFALFLDTEGNKMGLHSMN
ncbi:VOC family protein [Roseivirga thermotolerans]|uniref:VOC family protein n=1 Tax=Roseivirga thermotolerans TaxID=1758176 RepID=UPI00273ED7FE|nr:VOC family protein [Roseivirga thermotolerans]